MTAIALGSLVTQLVPTREQGWQLRLVCGWQQAVGDLCQQMRLERIDRTMLIVGVYDSHWMHELQAMAPRILQAINQYLGATYLQQIRFFLARPTLATVEKKKNDVSCTTPIKTGRPVKRLSASQEQALLTVKNNELQEVLRSFFYRCAD